MRKQQQIWAAEHATSASLTKMAGEEPASGVVAFVQWLKEYAAKPGHAVDIGSGKGRNAIYLAQQGYVVDALEYIAIARQHTKTLAKAKGLETKVHSKDVEIDGRWPYEDNVFDVAIDSFASIDVETLEGRRHCRDEMYRTLKHGGYALVTVCSVDDEWERELLANHPGPEPNSTIWPSNGKFQKDYSEEELREFYEMFTICELKTIHKPAHKLGRNGTATNFWLVIQKK